MNCDCARTSDGTLDSTEAEYAEYEFSKATT